MSKTIFLVDDSATVLMRVAGALTKARCAVQKASNGIEVLRRSDSGFKPDLHKPVMNRSQLIRDVRKLNARLLRTSLIGLMLCCAMPLAMAEDDGPDTVAAAFETTWNCWHARGTNIQCRLADAPEVIEEATAHELQEPGRPTTLPQRGRLPEIAETILKQATKLRARTISIPMYSHPESMAKAEQLADAVMCGARKSCRVQFFRSVALAALYIVGDPALD